MKRPSKRVTFLISVSVVLLLFFASNIYGYFRFKSYCSSEGGLHVYEKLEKNVGWLAKDKYEARDASLIKNVAFVRYADRRSGNLYDLNYLGGNPTLNDSYSVIASNLSTSVKYEWKNNSEFVDNNKRLKKFSYEVINLTNQKVVAEYDIFYYSSFGGALGGPDWKGCTNRSAKFDAWVEAFNKIFY